MRLPNSALALLVALSPVAIACSSDDNDGPLDPSSTVGGGAGVGGTAAGASGSSGFGAGGGGNGSGGSSGVSGGGVGGSVAGAGGSGPDAGGSAGTAGNAGAGGGAGSAFAGTAGAGGSSAGAGGVGGAAGIAGAGGSGATGSECGAAPVNPNASPEARKLLCYLYSVYGKSVLSGQQETSWAQDPEKDMKYINSKTGKYPAIRGLDYVYYGGTTNRAIAWWKDGGIPMICYHMGAPNAPDNYDGSKTRGNIAQALTDGTDANKVFKQRLDKAAAELQKLQDAKVPVLWRPFHEAGGTWFWWSMEGGANYVKLWNYVYDYYTNSKKLNNLIWMHPYNGQPDKSFYPGKATVDVGGADTYATNVPFTDMFNKTKAIVGDQVPIALHENGLMPDPDGMFGNGNSTHWFMFSTWADTYLTETNSESYLKKVYSNQYVITRDEVPNLK